MADPTFDAPDVLLARRWMMFNTSQSDFGSKRRERDLRQRRLLYRRNRPSWARNRIAMGFCWTAAWPIPALANDAGRI